MKDFNIGSEKMTRNGLKMAISYFCDIWIETDYTSHKIGMRKKSSEFNVVYEGANSKEVGM